MQLDDPGRAVFADRIYIFDSLDSTSGWLIRKEFRQPVICLAHQQTKGQGRRNKVWQGPSGNLALSCSLPADICGEVVDGISLVVALAVRSALEEFGVHAQVKWPNDLMVREQKCAGILLHIKDWHEIRYIIIGIGINNRHAPHPQSTSIYEQTSKVVDNLQLAARIIDSLIGFLMRNKEKGFQYFRDLWLKHDIWYGKQVQLVATSQSITAYHMGIDESGRILLGNGHQSCAYSSGEISLRLGACQIRDYSEGL